MKLWKQRKAAKEKYENNETMPRSYYSLMNLREKKSIFTLIKSRSRFCRREEKLLRY